MKIRCDRLSLSDAIDGVSKAVSSKSMMPVLEGILLKAEQSVLTLTGYDLEMAIVTKIACNVLEEGELVLPGKLFGEMIRRTESGEVEISSTKDLQVQVKGGITEFNFTALPAEDFPALPTPGAEPVATVEPAVLRKMIDSTIYAVSQDEKRPAHTGELLAFGKDALTVVALDGFRLALAQRPVEAKKELSIIVPAKTLLEVSRLLAETDQKVDISANHRYVVFAAGNYVVISRLLEGAFLDYKKVIPEGSKARVVVNVKEFIAAIERASLVITERLKNPLRVEFSGPITIRCQTALGKVSDSVEAKLEGEEMEIGFNNRYLLDALRNTGAEQVAFELTGPLSPAKILPLEGEDFLFLVLPVRFKNE